MYAIAIIALWVVGVPFALTICILVTIDGTRQQRAALNEIKQKRKYYEQSNSR